MDKEGYNDRNNVHSSYDFCHNAAAIVFLHLFRSTKASIGRSKEEIKITVFTVIFILNS